MTAQEVLNLVVLMVSIVLVANIVMSVITLFIERRDPSSLWAWILVLTFIPVFGFLLYLLIGRRLSRRKIFSLLDGSAAAPDQLALEQRKSIADNSFEFTNPTAADYGNVVSLLAGDAGAPLSENNSVRVFHDGREKFDALIADIQAAQDHVHVLYYIFRPDKLGMRILDALTERAAAGVEVRLCYDALGGKQVKPRHLTRLRAAGGKVCSFFPNEAPMINFRINYRTHRKMVVIDGRIGYVGGFNVGDEYLGEDPKFGYWRDTHLRITGGAVTSIQNRLLVDWNVAAPKTDQVHWLPRYFPDRTDLSAPLRDDKVPGHGHADDLEATGNVALQIASSGPDEDSEQIKYGYLKMIYTATESVFIQTPYLMPDAAMLEALKVASRSGIDVRITIPDKPDHMLVYPATLSYADELVACGAKVFIYQGGFMHAKTLLVDEAIGSVGTANFDYRSFRLNFEVNAFFYDADLGKEMADIYRTDLEKCKPFDHAEVYKHPFIGRVKEGVSRLVSPLL